MNRKPPFGHEVLAAVNRLPQYTIDLTELSVSVEEDGVVVELDVECGLKQAAKTLGLKKNKKSKRTDMSMVLTLTSDSHFVDFRRIPCVGMLRRHTVKP